MTDLILTKLRAVEEEKGIRILYACESGSRAWGFASADSDFDIRAIYVWPKDRYLGILSPPDSFDFAIDENDLDLSCWDLRKALPLFRKANGPLYEWLHSPIIYFEDKEVVRRWRGLVRAYFVPRHSSGHYVGLARQINGAIREKGQVTAKKYLYVLRALLSAVFIVDQRQPPPVDFGELGESIPLSNEVSEEIAQMIFEKSDRMEGDAIDRSEVLDAFIDQCFDDLTAAVSELPSEMGAVEPLDDFFRSVIS